MPETLSDKIKELRVRAGLTQPQLADAVSKKTVKSISGQAIASYEQGRRDVSTDVLSALADALNTSTDALLGRADGNGARDSADDGDEELILTTWVRAQKRLSPGERKKFFNMVRARFPELFDVVGVQR
jgi:transcriptional regulator with XRE-family HTH domain